ncbi:HNH endonuclease [Fontisphaera persica]|uniref:HNH endonuclease n=1 Tax=Fontisphaera persica TaxID=2974023 RepID=UPI0024BF6DFA|nr:HNH endonuclease [Fontisphaera persica]WCJ58852.1 HNH endonuclease [Fontisphaera persica]
MQHHERAGALEVDHFDPRKKKDLIQQYDNLFPASRHCNGKKSDHWPSRTEQAAGCRFLNPCREIDYGEQIFEDPHSHLLIGLTPAAKWHIRICALNADHLVRERQRRAEYWQLLKSAPIRIKDNIQKVRKMVEEFRREVEIMIPEIPPPPV